MSKQKKGLFPKLRFPEFVNEGGWELKPIGDGFKRVTTKNTENNQNALTISAQQGLVSQLDYFNKKVAAKDLSGYYLLHKGDFAYNKSYSQGYPMGAIKSLKLYEKGVVSTLYICFRASKGFCNEFYEHYFEAGMLNQQIESIAQEGGRAHGLLNVSVKEFFKDVDILVPTIEEQQKIADCFVSIDELITLHTKKLEALKDHKKGLMQQLFPAEGATEPKLRFPEFRGKGSWLNTTLSDLCDMQAGKFVKASEIFECRKEGLFPCYGGNGLRGFTKTYTHEGVYSLIGRQGALCGNVTLVGNKFHATEHAVVVTPKEGVRTDWLYFMLIYLELNRYATGQAQPGLSVENLNKVELKFTSLEEEQRKIASLLSTSQELIDNQILKIEQIKAHKKGLMQKLFPAMDEVN